VDPVLGARDDKGAATAASIDEHKEISGTPPTSRCLENFTRDDRHPFDTSEAIRRNFSSETDSRRAIRTVDEQKVSAVNVARQQRYRSLIDQLQSTSVCYLT
jgi:hypothetical protein